MCAGTQTGGRGRRRGGSELNEAATPEQTVEMVCVPHVGDGGCVSFVFPQCQSVCRSLAVTVTEILPLAPSFKDRQRPRECRPVPSTRTAAGSQGTLAVSGALPTDLLILRNPKEAGGARAQHGPFPPLPQQAPCGSRMWCLLGNSWGLYLGIPCPKHCGRCRKRGWMEGPCPVEPVLQGRTRQ